MKRFLLLLCALLSFSALAAPKADLWPYWQQSNEVNQTSISHLEWQQLLDSYLVTRGDNTLFRYNQVSFADKTKLKQYIQRLASLNPLQYRQAEQYAYWVNLYNALTVDLILDNYPITSITKLGGLFSFGPWDQDVIIINGKSLTLNDIEHRILRPIWQDPRTHYAINCASLGCPNLQTQAFTAESTQTLLENAAKTFINSKKGVSIEGDTAKISSIYEWFAVDFGGEKEVFNHIRKYAPQYNHFSGRVKYDYDWNLNQAD
ncbi:DUF547 domain-containing protein [Vibrio parahaemolyticus]|uniref:DUF547 domain-containing protein n=1 Tax=Vibrio parahaemolyticus TaxID=670 RepID=UPI0004067B28|nr:DUF547 domain-containing protein [Vibrio parahaemolyticus]EIF8961129.1 DUF547 domain-containing protein [Vibrio parahaemolyticus]EIO4085610.1 DUF547 domain-containing protein [Vibrio parahaemolyticus]TOL24216.1 DUF547 domain-containing protein [Vibrio parahaemolyticus]TOL62266.1 DUF547 domain-containing protein [Vibrio parahaemolyticus]TOL95264.1 DUF547 domain-containing protein [Vibrio parahaemolyticus]